MAELKTKPNRKSVAKFVKGVENERRRADAGVLLEMMGEVTGEKPRMWGDSIVGFGDYHYTYKTGREGDWFKTGFSPRKTSLSLYIMCNLDPYKKLLAKLGKHKRGAGCLYINKLDDVDLKVLREIVQKSVDELD